MNRFEISTPTVDLPSSLCVFDWPLFEGGFSGLGVLHVLGEEEGLAIVAENEIEGGNGQESQIVGFGSGDGGEEATPLAVEGYERWEDNMLAKFSEFLGFSTVGFEPHIIDLLQKLLDNRNQGSKLGQTPVFRREHELKKLECIVNYGG